MIIRMFTIAALCAASGCASFKEMASNFDARWDNPDAVLAEMAENEPLSEADRAELIDRLAGLTDAGDCGKIADSAARVLAFDETNVSALLALGECDLKMRDLASAKGHFARVSVVGEDARALRGLGVIATLEGRSGDAEAVLREAARLNENDWRTWNALGYALDQQARWAESEAAFLKAASLDSDRGAPHNNLGMSYIQQKRYLDAAGAFREALGRQSDLQAARLNLRIAQALDGDYATALVGATDSDRATVLNNIGVAAMTRGDYEQAKKFFRQALDENPTFYAVAYENLERARHLSAN